MQRESFLHSLLETAYQNREVNIYDYSYSILQNEADSFSLVRGWVHEVVKEKLLQYSDENHTTICITNYGRYWMLHGGYLGYLRDEHDMKVKRSLDKQQHEERLLEARLKLTKYRLIGFWIALIVSALGLSLSVLNLYMILHMKNP